MKKVLFAVIAASVFTFAVSAQNSLVEDPNPETIGNESAMQALHEISLDKFEREGSWGVHISPDYGVITGRLFEGSPAMKDPLKEDEGKENEDTQVLGVKVEFFKRGINSFYITSQRPIPIEGVTKTVSVWVCGRNMGHELYLLVEDYFGRNYELYMGSLGFSGWKKLTAVVPPSPDGEHGIVQHSAYYCHNPGQRIIGFGVEGGLLLSSGAY